jgi:hypothetical protein
MNIPPSEHFCAATRISVTFIAFDLYGFPSARSTSLGLRRLPWLAQDSSMHSASCWAGWPPNRRSLAGRSGPPGWHRPRRPVGHRRGHGLRATAWHRPMCWPAASLPT